MRVVNYYAVLGVRENADAATIRRAFKSQARRYHPDVGRGSSTAKFCAISEAYGVLADPQRRREHDINLAWRRSRTNVVPEPLIPNQATGRQQLSAAEEQFVAFLELLELAFMFHW
jgi:curved DNA-binding protein CbpA